MDDDPFDPGPPPSAADVIWQDPDAMEVRR